MMGTEQEQIDRVERSLARLTREVTKLRMSVEVLQHTTVSRKAVNTALLLLVPVITGLIVTGVAIGDRLWGG
jgi:hypothetical protein